MIAAGDYSIAPSGQRDTYTMHRMRNALRERSTITSAQRWAALPLVVKHWLCFLVFGPAGDGMQYRKWDELEPRQRIALGVAWRNQAAGLVV